MADEDKAKAEKLAAAKKRNQDWSWRDADTVVLQVEEMKKKSKKKTSTKKEDKPESAPAESSKAEDAPATPEPTTQDEEEKLAEDGEEVKDGAAEKVPELSSSSHQRKQSLSVQSKMRSSSFRQGSAPGPMSPNFAFSPEGDTAPDIYRKQAIKIDELEKENKRLAKEATDGEKRWKKAEEELEELREAEDDSTPKKESSLNSGSSQEVEKLKTEIAALHRQNTQLQAQSSRVSRHGSSPSVSQSAPADHQAALASKSSTIESMEIEISNLRAHLDKVNSGASVKEQISALEEKLARSERSAVTAQRELGDLKKNLDRTTEKAVKEGSERISAETKLRTLEREAGEAKSHSDELQKKVDALEKKVATLATLHKEHDARFQAQKKERVKAEKDASELRARIAGTENENLRLKEERERLRKRDAQGVDDEGVDELENEERQRLEKKVRDLESEVHELRRGVWRDRRKELEGEDGAGITSPGARFTDVDLGGSLSPSRRRSLTHGGKGFGDFLSSGFNAITGGTSGADDALLEDEGDLDFDEDAFRLAQEEEAKKRIERVKEVKRGLKNWEGWRLDLVENRRGGGEGVGEIFEI
ncbi:hypothetical protein LCER1_G002909 [Lachnellula cervina]|uniref:M protein repeat protein n=1 Tax=Lachnellula cervina TaxID=1316786 RepID=A0A7D8Z8H2_9HELO|nr:hypothetical protein LCER1_G002909 [Lachnellula cervina]